MRQLRRFLVYAARRSNPQECHTTPRHQAEYLSEINGNQDWRFSSNLPGN